MEKKSFILFTDRKKEIDMLSDAKCGTLFKAIFQYVETGDALETSDLALQVLFSFITSQIDESALKWEHVKQKRSEAGKKSGEARRRIKQNQTKRANINFVEQTQTKRTVTDTVTGTVTVPVTNVTGTCIEQACTAPRGAAQPDDEIDCDDDLIPCRAEDGFV